MRSSCDLRMLADGCDKIKGGRSHQRSLPRVISCVKISVCSEKHCAGNGATPRRRSMKRSIAQSIGLVTVNPVCDQVRQELEHVLLGTQMD